MTTQPNNHFIGDYHHHHQDVQQNATGSVPLSNEATQPAEHFVGDYHHHHQQHPQQQQQQQKIAAVRVTGGLGHQMPQDDPENPQNWPIVRKIHVSLASSAFAFAAAFGLTSYTVGLSRVINEFDVSMTVAIIPFSIYLVGIAFAPIYTPHLSERYGRTPVYLMTVPIGALFLLGASRSFTFASLAVCRFFAGFFMGPSLVLIEGTFADVWYASKIVSYYSCLTLASYVGAAAGPLINGFIVAPENWRWNEYVPLIFTGAALLFGIGMPETYGREIVRKRARRNGIAHNLPKAQSGVTFVEMCRVTLITPIIMLFSEPLVILITIYVSFLFGTIFQFFILIPPVLTMTYNFTLQQVGIAFTAAIVGSLLAAATATAIERVAYPHAVKSSSHKNMVDIEYRLIPAMLGGIFMTASFFWIGWTAKPSVSYASPIIGTLLYVWGNMMILVSLVSYIFDAYPPAGTLSALTVMASMRLLVAAALPLTIIQFATRATGAWALGTYGFISAALMFVPFILYKVGPSWRMKSRYSAQNSSVIEGQPSGTESDVEASKVMSGGQSV